MDKNFFNLDQVERVGRHCPCRVREPLTPSPSRAGRCGPRSGSPGTEPPRTQPAPRTSTRGAGAEPKEHGIFWTEGRRCVGGPHRTPGFPTPPVWSLSVPRTGRGRPSTSTPRRRRRRCGVGVGRLVQCTKREVGRGSRKGRRGSARGATRSTPRPAVLET